MNRCDPLLAGLPQDPDYSVSCLYSPPSPSSVCLPANMKCDKYWGPSSDKALECTPHWSRTPEPETLGHPASGDTVRTADSRPGWGSGPPPHEAAPSPSPDLQKECCNDQDVLKRHHNVAKKPLETSSSKVKAKTIVMIPDSQKLLRCELESLKSQLQAQTKAFEFLNHSVTMLEKESCLQQIKIQQLEEAQEDEISENLVNIQKMQKTQVKCRKILTKMKQQGHETTAWPETEEILQGASGCWKDDLQKELSDIWSAVHVLQNSIDGLTMCSGACLRASNLRGHKGHWCLSPPLPFWDSDSDSDQDLSQPPFSKSCRSFPPGADPPQSPLHPFPS
ncbi:coiled-coil domain-containing protein 159 isoform X8 [Symphalangus syndactylus]|uniref:coiled-coil domain-containing protein 159 isoform X8 n=1 Tax=Symphalangus syndactylus TaxID=9590 RepID=UPI00244142D2|nr:coiled-coil domain-containing protein 159 isoform X5 [Symphalangus syndactylus]